MRSFAAASISIQENSIGTLFRHPTRGRNLHGIPSSPSRWSPWRGGSSSPSELRVCTSRLPVSMCLISLSLSRVLDLAWSGCTVSFATIVGSYGVSRPLPSCNEPSLAHWGFVMLDWVLDLRTLDVCLVMGYLWWQWDVLLIHLMYVLALNSWILEVTLG